MIRKQFIVCVFLSVILVSSLNKTVYGASDFRAGINGIVNQIINSMETKNKKNLAVMDFKNIDHSVSKMGMYLSETLITKLFQTDKFEVIERSQLDQALKEIGLSQTGIIDSETTKKVGKILGVDSLAIGTITDLVDTVEINARLVSTETGKVFAVASSEVKKDKVVAKLLGQTIQIGSLVQSTPQYSEAKVTLRSSPTKLNRSDIESMVQEHDFFDKKYNPSGFFRNVFEEMDINGVIVIVDKATGLMWLQGGSNKVDHSDAIAYAARLNRTQLAGFTDWRLPTAEEAATLLYPDKLKGDLYVDPVFSKKQKRIWTGDRMGGSECAWNVDFYDGYVGWGSISDYRYVRPVRSVE